MPPSDPPSTITAGCGPAPGGKKSVPITPPSFTKSRVTPGPAHRRSSVTFADERPAASASRRTIRGRMTPSGAAGVSARTGDADQNSPIGATPPYVPATGACRVRSTRPSLSAVNVACDRQGTEPGMWNVAVRVTGFSGTSPSTTIETAVSYKAEG